MFVRNESRVVATVAFMLLIAAGAGTCNWLLAAAPLPASILAVVNGQPDQPTPHLSLSELKLAGQNHRETKALSHPAHGNALPLQAAEILPADNPAPPPAEPKSVAADGPTPQRRPSPNLFASEAQPHFFVGSPQPVGSTPLANSKSQPPKRPAEAAVQPASNSAKSEPSLVNLPPRGAAPNTPLQSTGIALAPRPEPAQPETKLANLPQVAANNAPLKPAEVLPAGQPHFFHGPFRLASLPNAEHTPLKPAQPTEVPAVQPASFSAQETPLADLPQRFPGPSIALHSTEVQPARPPKHVAGEMHLVSLPQRFPTPAVQLNPAEVSPVQSSLDPMLIAEKGLVSLQQRAAHPATPLQPAEVLPIPTPNSPATRVPSHDQDRPIAALTTNIAPPTGKLPTDMAAQKFGGDFPAWLPRPWGEVTYFWDAPDLCYGPLRYEEVNLERYGYSHCPIVQPALSAAHFFCATLALPYNMTVHPHKECIYPLGHYRPGSPVPFRHIRPEASALAASAEVGTIAGLILLIP